MHKSLVAILIIPVLAGCIGSSDEVSLALPDLDPLTEPIYEILGHFEHSFAGTTGTTLYVDYYRPDLPGGDTSPVILVFTPYQDDMPDPGVDPFDPTASPEDPDLDPPYSQRLVDHWVPRGYTVAFADVRGNHRAGGCIDQTGPEQWQDGYDYVEWLGTQEWSNGKVGMHGASYDGETQFTTAMMAPPHLATIVPTASVSNQYEWSFYNGVPYELQPFIGMFSYFQGSAVPSTDPMLLPSYPEKLECQQQQFEAGLDFSGDHTTFWQERDYRSMAGNINASVLHVHGLGDWNVRPIHIDPLFNDIQSEKRGIFGQWGHAYPDREDWMEILNAWYDHFLLGRNTGILERLPPVLIEDNQGDWHGIDSFPPQAQEWLSLELDPSGALVVPGEAETGQAVIQDIPEEFLADLGAGQAADEARREHAREVTFTFKADREMRLVGRPYVDLTADSSATSTHWVAQLYLDGQECRSVCENMGYQDTRHRESHTEPSDITPGEVYPLRIDMYPQYDVIPAGSTVILVLTNNSPDIQQDDTGSINTIHFGDGASLLHLPLAPTQVSVPENELPAKVPTIE